MKHLRHWRKQAGLKVSDLAQEMKISEVTLWRWERDKSEPNASEVKKLCEVLHVSEAELLNGPQSKVQRFELILDPDDKLKMEVVNMTNTAIEEKTMSVSTKRIGLILNMVTAGMSKKEARDLMLQSFDEVFNDAWAQQMKWQKRGAEA